MWEWATPDVYLSRSISYGFLSLCVGAWLDAGQENSAITSSLAQNQHGRYSKTCPSYSIFRMWHDWRDCWCNEVKSPFWKGFVTSRLGFAACPGPQLKAFGQILSDVRLTLTRPATRPWVSSNTHDVDLSWVTHKIDTNPDMMFIPERLVSLFSTLWPIFRPGFFLVGHSFNLFPTLCSYMMLYEAIYIIIYIIIYICVCVASYRISPMFHRRIHRSVRWARNPSL